VHCQDYDWTECLRAGTHCVTMYDLIHVRKRKFLANYTMSGNALRQVVVNVYNL